MTWLRHEWAEKRLIRPLGGEDELWWWFGSGCGLSFKLVLAFPSLASKATPPNPLIGLEAKGTNIALSPSAVGFGSIRRKLFGLHIPINFQPCFFFFLLRFSFLFLWL